MFVEGLKNILRNLRLMWSSDLRQFVAADAAQFPSQFVYELADRIENRPMLNVMSGEETLDYVEKNDVSWSRFGDGEFALMEGRDIYFQPADERLQRRLKEIFSHPTCQCLICCNYKYFHSIDDLKPVVKRFYRGFSPTGRRIILANANKAEVYGDSGFLCSHTCRENAEEGVFYDRIRKLWEGRDVVVVAGLDPVKDFKSDPYCNAKSMHFMRVPTQNAFSSYDEILRECRKFPRDLLLLVSCGPTASILCYDLSKDGYRALDMGHFAEDYESFLLNETIDAAWVKTLNTRKTGPK